MAIIYSYPQGTPTLLDNVIGSQIDPTTEENKTVQFTIGSIATLIGSGSGGSGTVISVATSNGTFVNVTGGTITATGTITGDLSATGLGSPTSNYFLRGDNTWAIPAGSGSVTTISSTIAGDAFDVAITNPSTTPALGFTWAGTASQYVTGQGNLETLTIPFTSLSTVGSSGTAASLSNGVLTIPTPVIPNVPFTSLTTTGTSGVSTLNAGVLNVPDYSSGAGTVQSVGLSIDESAAISISNSPITNSGTIALSWQGDAAQVVLGSGELGTYFTGTTTATNAQAFTNKTGSNNQWTNDAGYITTGDLPTVNNATITITTGTGLDGSPASFTTNQSSNETIALSLNLTEISLGLGLDSTATGLSLDLSELTDMTAAMLGTDEFIVLDAGAERRKAANEIGLSIFDNDIGFVINEPAITTNGSAPSLASGISEQSVRGLIKAQFDVGLLQDTVTVTAAQLNSLSTTPVVLIASPGINKYIKVIEASFYYLVGSVIHTFTGDIEAQINSINQFTLQDSVQPTFGRTTQIRSLNILHSYTSIAENTRLLLTTDVASSTAGNGTAEVKIMYQILDTTAF